MGCVLVEEKATGTGRAQFALHKNQRIAGFVVVVATITTVTDVSLKNQTNSPVLAKQRWRDILNNANTMYDKETAETTIAAWTFTDNGLGYGGLPDLGALPDPVLEIERGGTTTTSSVYQMGIF
jgi:hypothetical protein